jgi:hypothetical protein
MNLPDIKWQKLTYDSVFCYTRGTGKNITGDRLLFGLFVMLSAVPGVDTVLDLSRDLFQLGKNTATDANLVSRGR